jgi:superfamily I DNA/RNA helicase
MPFRAGDLILPIESPIVDDLLAGAREASAAGARGRDSALLAIAALPERARLPEGERLGEDDPRIERRSIAAALQGWAAPFRSIDDLAAAIESTRSLLASLRVDDAALSLATAHGTKGLEFDHVAVIGLDEGRFPSARSIADALEPERAMEEERRLAYVAWTRARRSLTLLYDPAAPTPFLLEAFSPEELGLVSA